MAAGIAFVHQELNLFDNLSVAANVYIGREPPEVRLPAVWSTKTSCRRPSSRSSTSSARRSRPATPVARLSIAEQQIVEIAKALSLQSRLVILDEPTSSLPIAETDKLLEVIAGLKAHGISVIFISHRLHEVVQASDRVLVLRDGKLVGTLEGADINHDAMVRLMVGRELKVDYVPPSKPRGEVVVSIKSACARPPIPAHDIDLDLRAGEILGLAGLVGAGRTRTRPRPVRHRPAGAAAALRSTDRRPRLRPPPTRVDAGIFLVPEDRKGAGLVLDFPIAQNITLPNLRAYSRNGLVFPRTPNWRARDRAAPTSTSAPPMSASARPRSRAATSRRWCLAEVAGDEAQGHHLRRADARHRRRREGRNLPPDARPVGFRGRRC